MKHIGDLPTPALLIDVDVLDANLRWMADRARALGVQLRPHIKTHKCVEIGQRQRVYGACGVTVSTPYEARVFADHGFDDITWAFPVVPSWVDEIAKIAHRTNLKVVVDTLDAVDILERAAHQLDVLIKVDCGYHRAGVDPTGEYAVRVAQSITDAKHLKLFGILSHSGHAYLAESQDDVAAIAEQERRVMSEFGDRLRSTGIPVQCISVGSTPSMRAARTLEGVTEARPGNYALFDYTQVAIGSCTPKECAATILTTVVSSQPGSEHSIVDAGALALSKDPGPTPSSMGEVYGDYAAGTLDPEQRLVSLSQEHGRLNRPLAIGTRLRILPNHSCLAVAHFDTAYAIQGEAVVDEWTVWRGRSSVPTP